MALKDVIELIASNLYGVTVNSESLKFASQTDIPTPDVEIAFDMVVRNAENKIVCVGDYLPNSDYDKKEEEIDNKLVYAREFPVFFVTEGGGYHFINPRYGDLLGLNTDLVPEEFFKSLKKIHPELLSDCERKISELEEQLSRQTSSLNQKEKENVKLTKELARDKDYYYNRISSLEKELEKNKEVEQKRIEEEYKICHNKEDLIRASNNIELPGKKERTSETRYGYGASDVQITTGSIRNNSSQFFISEYMGQWYLKIDLYDFFEKGPCDVPMDVFSNSIYYKFDTGLNEYIQIDSINLNEWKAIAKD
jgi:hypothetical protein